VKKVAVVSLALALILMFTGCIQVNVGPGTSSSSKISSAPTVVPTSAPSNEPTPMPSPGESGSPIPLELPYTSQDGSFSVIIPTDWKYTNEGAAGNEIAIFQAPSADPQDSPAAAMFMGIVLPGPMPSAKYQTLFEKTMNATAKDIKMIDQGTRDAQGAKGYYFEFTGNDNSGKTDQLLHFGYFFFVRDTHLFVVAFSAYDAVFAQYSDVFGKMFDSFTILV
jgi:hypothetical protein